LKISQKYFRKIIDDLLKGKKWLQMYKLLIEHANVHNGDWFLGCASDIQMEMVIRCLKEENPTISPHTLSDVVYVFLKNGGTLLHLEDGNNLKLVGNEEKNKCQSKLYEGQGSNWNICLHAHLKYTVVVNIVCSSDTVF
jgi:hypothetical protein